MERKRFLPYKYSEKGRLSLIFSIFLFCSFCVILAFVDETSVFSYAYTIVLFLVLNSLLFANNIRNLYYFHYYLSVSIILYAIHSNIIPLSFGTTGPYPGLGMDDYNFYNTLISNNAARYNYTAFLRFIYPFEIHTVLNIVILNLLGITFLPNYVMKLSESIGLSDKTAVLAEKLTIACPFITYYGCILLRDMWIATLVVAGLYYYLQRDFKLLICLLLIFYIRFGSLVFLVVGILILMRQNLYALFHSRTTGRIVVLMVFAVILTVFIVIFPVLQELSGGKLEDGLFRASFYTKLESMDSDAFILRLMNLQFPLSLISLTLFFLFLPFLNVNLFLDGIFSNSRLFCSLLTPLMFFFLWRYIIQTTLQNLSLKYNRPIKNICYMAVVFAMCLGTVSLQSRHKTVLFPLLCILAAYGICNNNIKYKSLSIFMTVCIVMVQLYMAL